MALKLYDSVAIQVQFRSPLYFVWSMYTYICIDIFCLEHVYIHLPRYILSGACIHTSASIYFVWSMYTYICLDIFCLEHVYIHLPRYILSGACIHTSASIYFVWSMYTYICLDICDQKGSRPVKLLTLR